MHTAAQQRRALFAETDVLRLHDAHADAVTGLCVERYADYALVSAYNAAIAAQRVQIAQALLAWGARGVYYKQRQRSDLRQQDRREFAPPSALLGESAEGDVVVREHQLRFWARLGDGLSTGLFLDQRDNRQRLLADCRGARVLNLFAYTCSFSVAAGVGQAASVTSVDLSAAVLARGHENLRLNQLPEKQHRLLKADVRKWLQRARGRAERYDWIVLDPPSFATVGQDTLRVDRDYAQLVQGCLQILAPGGRLLAVLNHRGTSEQEHVQQLRRVAAQQSLPVAELTALAPAVDCAGPGATKSALLRLAP